VLLILIGLLGFSLIGVNFIEPAWIIGIDLIVTVLLLFLRFPLVGFYLLVATFPFIGWQIHVGFIDLPMVDAVAIFLLAAISIRYLIHLPFSSQEIRLKHFPGLLFALIFLGASALSVYFNNENLLAGIKYLFRPLVFFYLMFVALPQVVITDKKVFINGLKIILAVGLFSAVLGLLSVVFSQGPWYSHRAIPFELGNINLLGGNQNAVAEVLVIALPISLFFFLRSDRMKMKGYFLLAGIFMTVILIMTFSRSGWLALLVELLILLVVNYRKKFNHYALGALVFVIIFVPLLFYFTVWQDIDWVQSSNSSRLTMLEISWQYFQAKPWFGWGLNTFQTMLANTYAYTIQFGDPLESHGFLQKIAVESGLLGVCGFFGLLIYLLNRYVKTFLRATAANKNLVLCLILMFCGIVFFELFSTSYYMATVWLPIGIGFAGLRFYS